MLLLRRAIKKFQRPSLSVSHQVRRDLKEIPICEDLSFLVYWKVLKIGKGPAVVLKAFDDEILKFDCFGQHDGHYHIAPNYNFRIYFFEKTVSEQIQRTLDELSANGLRYLGLQKDTRIRAIKPSLIQYQAAIDAVEKQLTHFCLTVRELQ